MAMEEASILLLVGNHPNILHLLCTAKESGFICLFLPYIEGEEMTKSSLHDY